MYVGIYIAVAISGVRLTGGPGGVRGSGAQADIHRRHAGLRSACSILHSSLPFRDCPFSIVRVGWNTKHSINEYI